jgi:O-antigen ligase
VTVLERSVPGAEASSAAAGILGAQVEAHHPGPLTELGLASRTIVKHLALAVCLGAAALALLLRAAMPRKPCAVRVRPLGAPLAAAWPLALFAMLVIGGSGYIRLAGGGPALLRWAGAAFFLAMAWFSHKYTSYRVAALCAAYLVAFVWLPRLPRSGPLGRATAAYWGLLALLAAGAVAAAFALRGGEGGPTGNPEFRLHTYGAAWQRFLDSPLWGSGFAREATEKFTLYDIGIARNMLPTHSDQLDLLANGGLAGYGLFAAGVLMIAVRAWRRLLRPAHIARPEARYGHALALLSLAALLTSCFNPILLQPPMAALAWSNLGMLLGLALRAEEPPHGRGSAPPGR